jgi:hypothetical protein
MFNLISPSQMAQLVEAIIAKYGGEAQAHAGLGQTAGYLNPYVDQENRPNFLYGTGFLGAEASKQAVKYLNEKYGYTPGYGAGPKPYSMEEQKNATMYAYQNLLMQELQGKNATPNRDRLNQQNNITDLENLFNQFFGSGQLPGFGLQSGSEDQQFGYSPEQYQAMTNAYAQAFANPNTMAQAFGNKQAGPRSIVGGMLSSFINR